MDLYRQNILDHYKNPRNFGEIKGRGVVSHQETNASCGDDIKMSVQLASGKIKDIKFTGQGCAIAMAGASMLTEKVLSKKLTDVSQLREKNIISMFQVKVNPARKKCATLGWVALKNVLKDR